MLAAVPGSGDDPAKAVSFRDRIAPILVKKCLGCHDDRKSESRLNMKTFAILKKGGSRIRRRNSGSGRSRGQRVGPGDRTRRRAEDAAQAAPSSATTRFGRSNNGCGKAKFDPLAASEAETPISSLVDPLAGLPKIAMKAMVLDAVTSLAFAPDGKWLAAAVGKDVVLWNLTPPLDHSRLSPATRGL